MKPHNLIVTVVALLATADADSSGCSEYLGNYYCNQVDAITYKNVGGQGSYNKITNMNSDTGSCDSTPSEYSGSNSPLDEQVSLHFRGPLILSQFAVYYPSNSSNSAVSAPSYTKSRRSEHVRRHARHVHARERRAADPALGDLVTTTINGKEVSWVNTYSGEDSASESASNDDYGTASRQKSNSTSAQAHASSASSPSPSSSASSSSSQSNYTGSGWPRQAYYNGQQGTAQGLVFLNHMGGQGSGCFDYKFGNSLSYASQDGTAGSATPQTLKYGTIDDDTEIVIMADQACSSDSDDCGYYRPNTVAHYGWEGPQKAFLIEYSMPDSGKTSASQYDPVNMPAIWMLNAQIPRTLQYGEASCSCWTSGCGEFDIAEVLSPGYDKCKSTLHGNKAGGDSHWIPRPVNDTMKLAVLMWDDCIHLKVLDQDFDFADGLSAEAIDEITASTQTEGDNVSSYDLTSAVNG